MARRGASCAAAALLVGGVFYVVYLALVARRRQRRRRLTPRRGPLLWLGRPNGRPSRDVPRARPHSQEPDRMLTEKSTATRRPRPRTTPRSPAALDDLICYFEGAFVPMRDAKVSIMTHAFMYGTATFEGIRAYWNADQGRLYGLKVREHVERIRQSCRILLMEDVPVGRRADPPDRRDGPPQRLPRGRLHPAVVLQVDPRRSASASTTSRTSCTSSRCRSGTTSTPSRASG